MKCQRIIITALICLSAILSVPNQVNAAPPGTPLQKQIKVEFASVDQLNQLRSLDLDIWKIYADHVVAAVDYEKVAEIEQLGFSVEVISDDAWNVLAPKSTRPPSKGTFGSYHTHAEVEAMMRDMEASGVAKVYDIGDSVEGDDIWAVRISDNPAVDEDEPSVLFVGCHHAREWISVEVPLYIAHYLTANYATNPEIASMVDNQQIWVVPMLNPDGYTYSRTVNASWRKNRRNNGNGTYGVDLNRNYGYMWSYDNEGSSGNTGAYDYRGSAPFSEPETRALRDLCLAHPFRSMITYHNYGGEVAYPWGYKWESPPDRCRDRHMADVMRDLMNAVHGAGYTSEVYPYLTNGDTTDWTYGIFRIPSITIELRPTGTSGGSGFELPEDEIIPTCEENLPAALYLIGWNEADLNSDYIVNLKDFSILSSYWLTTGGCNLANLCCDGADIFGSDTVDTDDLFILADQWLAQSIIDSSAPSPDPMSFSSVPVATGDSSIAMTATTASDISGVEYFFDCTTAGGHDSGWQDGSFYVDTNLTPETSYTYTVIVRDKSANQNTTALSEARSATTLSIPSGPWIGTNKAVYAPGEDIVVYFANANGNWGDWVALFHPTTPSTNYNEIQWMYTDGTQSGTDGIYDGTLIFNGLPADDYEARLHFNDEYPIEASCDFTVE